MSHETPIAFILLFDWSPMNNSFERSPQIYIRIAGIFYLAIILLGMFGEMGVRAKLMVAGNPAATMQAISQSPLLWRAGIAGDLLMHVFDLPVIVVMYFLLKPVNQSFSLLAVYTNLIQTAVLVANKMTLLVPLFLLSGASYLKAFSPEQINALAYLAIKAHGYGFGVGLIFFGVACLVRGYLMVKAGYIPKILGILMLLTGWCYLINSFALLVAPALADLLFPFILLPPLVGELSFSLWMIVKGVNLAQWQQRVGDAAAR
jgi:hypothetical protein